MKGLPDVTQQGRGEAGIAGLPVPLTSCDFFWAQLSLSPSTGWPRPGQTGPWPELPIFSNLE